MDYVAPEAVLDGLVQSGMSKARLSGGDLLIRGALAGAILGAVTTLSLTATMQTGVGLAGALVFPIGLTMIALLGLELLTGNFAVVPLAMFEGHTPASSVLRNWSLVFLGNLLGALAYAGVFFFTVHAHTPIADRLIATAEAKTIAYQALGTRGMAEVFAKAILCNWMVTLGVVLAFSSNSVAGKAIGMWMPITTFVALGFEHSVVNMFAIPMGMALGAHVTFSQWWIWNQIPVTLGNLVGGLLFTGVAYWITYRKRAVS